MGRKTSSPALTSELCSRLRSLSEEAFDLKKAVEHAYACREQMRPLVRQRNVLQQELWLTKSTLQELQKKRGKHRSSIPSIESQIADYNKKIEVVIEPFIGFGERVANFIGRLKLALMLLPPGHEELQGQLFKLPLLTVGLGNDGIAVSANIGKIRENIEGLLTKLGASAAPGSQQSPKQTFGEQLRQKRADNGHTQAMVAELVGCDVGTISRVETGATTRSRVEFEKRLKQYIGHS
jgi:hypothetical protein